MFVIEAQTILSFRLKQEMIFKLKKKFNNSTGHTRRNELCHHRTVASHRQSSASSKVVKQPKPKFVSFTKYNKAC